MAGGTDRVDVVGWEGIGIVDIGVPRVVAEDATFGFWRGIGDGFELGELGNLGEGSGETGGKLEAE